MRCARRRFVRPFGSLPAVALLSGLALAADAPSSPPELARDILDDGRYQRELPERIEPRPPSSFLRWVGHLGRPLLVTAGLVSLALLLLWLASAVVARRREREAIGVETLRASPRIARSLDLAAAERLAHAGRHADAIHVLLIAAIERLSHTLDVAPAPSRTSRELEGLFPLGAAAREGFRNLVRQVEATHFGGRPVGPEDYVRSRAHFSVAIEGDV